MADNVYNLKFTLSNGDVIDAGQITAPQGPKGDKGDSADIPYSSSTPFMDGVGSVGSANTVARGDHRHPSDTSRQEKLVSGTNIKTINGQSVLGSGDIPISGGSEYANTSEIVDNAITLTSTSTLADLVTQILAQKTKVLRAVFEGRLVTILGEYNQGTMKASQNASSVLFKLVAAGYTATGPYTGGIFIDVYLYGAYMSVLAYGRITAYPQGSAYSANWKGWNTEAYPVGSIYLSYLSPDLKNPAYLFGGTWEQIKDVFLLAAGDTYTAGSTGGSADAVVVRHDHTFATGGSALGLNVSDSETETSAGFVAAPTGEGLWGNVNKASSGVASTGVDGAGKNMPPYLTVYMWERIA